MIVLTLALLLSPPVFQHQCAACHGNDGHGTAQGPGLAANPHIATQTDDQLRFFVQHGSPAAGMPGFSDLSSSDLNALVTYLRSISPGVNSKLPPKPPKISWRPPAPGDWLTYDGNFSANRFSPLKEINTANVAALKLKWIYPTGFFGLETTPLAADGVLYFTAPNQVIAIDALTGAELWKFSRPQTPGLTGDSKLGTNRGVAILNEKVFFVTDDAHLLALNRSNGELLWEVHMAEEKQEYGGTIAPLVIGDKVIVGVAGADHGIRGFVAAFKAIDGSLIWRRWTIPMHNERGGDTWKGPEPLISGGSTWLTGSYDPVTATLYWPTGNPYPDSNDRDRPGDNLFTDCILALDVTTGEIKWHYQFTPHDLKDRDATEPPVLIDSVYRGVPRKLLLQANRNGFFYVFDRTNGERLLARSFLRRDDWASSIGQDGRPVVVAPKGCPSDAANWDPAAFSPLTGLFYFMALEECTGEPTGYPDQTGQHYLRALNIETGQTVWEILQPGPPHAKTWSGVLATGGGLVFYGKPNGGFDAVDQRTGETLWHFPTNVRMKAPPITFVAEGTQYVVVAAGPNVLCFGF